MAKTKEANLISFKVVLTSNNQIVTEFSMLPEEEIDKVFKVHHENCLLYTSPSPRDRG